MNNTTLASRKHRVLLNTMVNYVKSNGTDTSIINFVNGPDCRPIQMISELLGDNHPLVTYKGKVHPYLQSGSYSALEIADRKIKPVEIAVLESARMFQDSIQLLRRSLRQNHGVNAQILTQLCKDWKDIIHDLSALTNK